MKMKYERSSPRDSITFIAVPFITVAVQFNMDYTEADSVMIDGEVEIDTETNLCKAITLSFPKGPLATQAIRLPDLVKLAEESIQIFRDDYDRENAEYDDYKAAASSPRLSGRI